LNLAGPDRADRPIAECRVGVSAQHRLDVCSRRWPVHLCSPPLLGVLTEVNSARAGIGVLAGDQRCGLLVKPALRI
jgi:hypothetical protein